MLRASLDSDVALIRQIAEYIIGGGGKRLRPALVLLAARACGYQGERHYTLAAVVEMIHTATLLHDDVVDESKLRRGHATANATFGNAAVGAGRRLPLFARVPADGRRRARCGCWTSLSHATNVIAEGEVLQLMNSGNPTLDEAAYLGVIQRKTAKLFEAAAQLGAVLGDATPERERALARYGMHLGTAFQLVDDVLDYSGDLDRDRQEPRRRSRRRQDDVAADPRGRGRQPARRRADPQRHQRRRAHRIRAGASTCWCAPARSTTRGARAMREARPPLRRIAGLPDSPDRRKSARIGSLRGPPDVLKLMPAGDAAIRVAPLSRRGAAHRHTNHRGVA